MAVPASAGENDQITPVETMEEIAAIAGAPLIVVKGSGHMTPMEKPSVVTGALHSWLQR